MVGPARVSVAVTRSTAATAACSAAACTAAAVTACTAAAVTACTAFAFVAECSTVAPAEEELSEKEQRALARKPANYRALFDGNMDDHFRVGIKLTRWERSGADVATPAVHRVLQLCLLKFRKFLD